MVSSVFLSRILGIGRDTMMVSLFGRGTMTDAYVLAFQIPDLFFYLLASGALSSAFIPVFSEYFHQGKKEDAWKVFSVVTTLMSLILMGLLTAAWIYAEPLTAYVALGKDFNSRTLIAQMSRILLPAQFAFLIGGLMFGTLYARQKFIAPGLGPNIYNLGIIFGATVISQFVSPGIMGLAWGALIGAFVGNLVVPAYVMLQAGSCYSPSLDLKHSGVRKVFRLMLPVVLGLSLPALYGMMMKYFGSFYPSGVNTSLDLSNKLMQAPLGIFGQSLAIAAFPALSQFFAQGEMELLRNQLTKSLRTVLYISVPISVFMYLFSNDIVTGFFQYGLFKSGDAKDVSQCLKMFTLGVPAWCLQPMLMRGYYAIQRTFKPVLFGSITTFIFLILAASLRMTSLSYFGLPLAGSLAAIFLAGIMLKALSKDIGHIDIRGILLTFVKAIFASGIACGIVYLFKPLLPIGSGLSQNFLALLRIFLFGSMMGWIYYAITKKFSMPETIYLDRVFKRINFRKKS